MKEIVIRFIPHSQQRQNDVGDWFFDKAGNLQIRITDLGDWKYNVLYARHELDEALLCKSNGITTEMVDEDDNYASDSNDPDSFSGYPGSCYQAEHNSALAFEWFMSRLLYVDWMEYASAVGRIESQKEKKNGT